MISKSRRIATPLAIFAAILLVGCRDFHTERQVGAFVIRSHVRQYVLSWENNSEPRFEEYCNVPLKTCFLEDKELKRGFSTLIEFSEPNLGAMVAFLSNNRNGRRYSRPVLSIFRAADGKEFKCRECNEGSGLDFGEVLQSSWNGSQSYFIDGKRSGPVGIWEAFWVVSIHDETFTVRKVREFEFPDGLSRIRYPDLSADGKRLAWLICNDECELFDLGLEDGKEIRSSVQCPEGAEPKLRWAEGRAFCICSTFI